MDLTPITPTNGPDQLVAEPEHVVAQVVATANQPSEPHLASGTGKPISDYPAPLAIGNEKPLVWNEDETPARNYEQLGHRLAAAGDLYRQPGFASGLLLCSSQSNIAPVPISKGPDLASIIVDRVPVCVMKDGKFKASRIPSHHLGTMLKSEAFLQRFLPVDAVVEVPSYLPDYQLPEQGYNDGGPGQRLLYRGPKVRVANTLDTIYAFLNVMDFATPADRTNAMALALTVQLRFCWPGAKPIGVVTSTKSHGGKDTVIAFAAGSTPKVSIDYQSTDWAFRQGLVASLQARPGAGVVCVENARLGRGDYHLASATLERILTDPEPVIHSSQARETLNVKNYLVFAISTNYGSVSEDLMNRALPIHLNPVGNVADRQSLIGNPKLEYLPANRERIEAELKGMIEHWKEQDRPLDKSVHHPFTQWAQTVGGILQVNGFTDFLGNYSLRRTADDPLRHALGLLGAARPDKWLRPGDWVRQANELGLVKQVIPVHQRDTDMSRERGIGGVLSSHRDETYEVESNNHKMELQLEKKRVRFEVGSEPETRYCFRILKTEAISEDSEPSSLKLAS